MLYFRGAKSPRRLKMKYTGSWSANNGSTYANGYESNNKKDLAKDLRKIVDGNVFAGQYMKLMRLIFPILF
jgi:hypothetical protein